MDPSQDRLARGFIGRIARDVELVERARGYDLQKPGSTRIGHVRYNVGGRDRGRYRVYAYEPFADPRQRFANNSANSRRGWTCLVNPDNDDDIGYIISVLESSYDQK